MRGGGFIGGHAMNSDNRLKTMAGLSQLWNADPVNRVRSGDGVSSYPGRRLAMHLMAQAIAVRPLLADPQASGQGFLARFLITEPPSAIGTCLRRGHAPASDAVLKDFSARVMSLLNAPLPTGDHPQELMPRRLLLSPAAEELLWRFHETIEKEQGPGGALEHIRSFASKVAEQEARLAGILTLWADFDAVDVKVEAMGCGITLAQFYLTEAKRLVEAGLVSAKTAQAEMLRKWLLESYPKDWVTPSDILKLGPNAMRERAKLNEPLAMLVKAGWLVRLNDGVVIAGKPRKEAYKIVRGSNVL
ncbi:hypothetical protein CDV52_17350 [Haematobacter missouriensis]|uniref:DUF3987 domain-containing protein n=2 Tax=Haematobacter missouriensis TaxID=366616 RepID=A0A212AJR7_9RHOB|nr:hypothetical protein CDV53_07665 [Haematobacter missouriensis]OWJ81729.1 hypothetical protein CDV52_17350 [Haematobacter missouriensis]